MLSTVASWFHCFSLPDSFGLPDIQSATLALVASAPLMGVPNQSLCAVSCSRLPKLPFVH